MSEIALEGLVEFEAVARRLSFTAAAQELRLDATVLGRRVRKLETRLGVRLLHRTTRRVALTESGDAYLASVQDLLARATEAAAAATRLGSHPAGRLRIALPNLFGQTQVAPLLPDFLDRYDELKLDLTFSDQFVDLLQTRVDCAVRIGALEAGGDLKVRNIAPNRRLLCASPAYLKRAGAPHHPRDLTRHRLLHFRPLLTGDVWRLERGAERHDVAFDPFLSADNAEALRLAAVAGAGIGLLATFVIGDDLRAGRLVPVLPDWRPPRSVVSIVYPDAPHVPLKVRAFVDFMHERFRGEPPWDRDLPAS